MSIFYFGILFVMCYLIGSFPSGFLVVKQFTGKNILEHGTGNVGTMNTHRTTNNKFLTILVLILDLLKGGLAYFLAVYFTQNLNISLILGLLISGLAVILGHNYSIYLKFKGGKGLATGAGFLIWLNPWLVFIWCTVFLIVVAVTKYMVLGQMIASLSLPIASFILDKEYIWIVLGLSVLVALKHYPRMKNVMNGTEPKMYYKVK